MESSKNTNIIITILSIALVAAISVLVWFIVSGDQNPATEDVSTSEISSFQDCVDAGFPVMESYPRQCKTDDGATYTEELPNDEQDEIKDDGPVTYTSNKGVDIVLETPLEDEIVSSPMKVKGQVPGSWSFEADFPVVLTDWDGRIIAEGIVTMQGDWMTEELVPFEAELTFMKPTPPDSVKNTGSLILQKDNPSGLPENDDALEITVAFE